MMKKSHWLNKIAFPVVILTTLTLNTNAQKLSTIQEGSLWAPQKVKIDGKIEEWGDNFQAYNKTTKLYYTLSNDEKNLYLVVRSEDVQNSTKVMGGGVTLTINTSDKKKEENAFSVKFPIVNRNSLRGIRRPRGASQTTAMDSASMAEAAAARKQVIASIKEISVLGFKDITDTLISIYNEYGIKASAGYDDKANLQYELAIPLSLLNISTDRPKEFAYNIKVNGIDFSGGRRPGGDGGPGGNGGGRNGGAGGGNAGGGGGFGGGGGGRNGGGVGGGFGGGGLGQGGATNNPMNELLSPTDFWGKYTLAKKPASFGLTNN